jgi:hypothetical protein
MTTDERNGLKDDLRDALRDHAPAPDPAFRRRAFFGFGRALDRHLRAKRLRAAGSRR